MLSLLYWFVQYASGHEEYHQHPEHQHLPLVTQDAHLHFPDVHYDPDSGDVHCDPYVSPLEQCPGGAYCIRQNLNCKEDYCICPLLHVLDDIHCDPSTFPLQQCPNGAYCIRQNLDCNEEYCVCPSYNGVHHDSHYHYPVHEHPVHEHPVHEHPVHEHPVHEVHCDPSTWPLQQCPNGAYCIRQNLDCKEDYCICSLLSVLDDIHCDPSTFPLQQCPNGAYCIRQNLDCNEEYCVCPSYNHEHPVHEHPVHEHPVHEHPVHEVHCDPSSWPLQECPNGAYCIRKNLDCNEEYCVCPSHNNVHHDSHYEHPVYEHRPVYELPAVHHEHAVHACEDFVVSSWHEDFYQSPQWIHHCPEIHCNPYAKRMQVCPNGQLCLKGHLYCNMEYCICGTHQENQNPVDNLAHCDPHSTRVQYYPNGDVCNPNHLICVGARNIHTYCVCPSF